VQTPVDLPSAIAAINQLKLLVQMMSGSKGLAAQRATPTPCWEAEPLSTLVLPARKDKR